MSEPSEGRKIGDYRSLCQPSEEAQNVIKEGTKKPNNGIRRGNVGEIKKKKRPDKQIRGLGPTRVSERKAQGSGTKRGGGGVLDNDLRGERVKLSAKKKEKGGEKLQ